MRPEEAQGGMTLAQSVAAGKRLPVIAVGDFNRDGNGSFGDAPPPPARRLAAVDRDRRLRRGRP